MLSLITILFYLLEQIVIYWTVTLLMLCYYGQLQNSLQYLKGEEVFRVLRNQSLLVLPMMIMGGIDSDPSPIPLLIIFQFIVSTAIQSILFYFIHRLFHTNRFLYTNFHLLHHQHRTTWPHQAVDCTILEHLLCNLVPLFAGPWLIGMNVQILRVWGVVATCNTVWSHSGGARKASNIKPTSHDIHHSHVRYNFGVGTSLDKLFGTYKEVDQEVDQEVNWGADMA